MKNKNLVLKCNCIQALNNDELENISGGWFFVFDGTKNGKIHLTSKERDYLRTYLDFHFSNQTFISHLTRFGERITARELIEEYPEFTDYFDKKYGIEIEGKIY